VHSLCHCMYQHFAYYCSFYFMPYRHV
jgi:hypothetical protein